MRTFVLVMFSMHCLVLFSSFHKLLYKSFPIMDNESIGERCVIAIVSLGLIIWAAIVLWG